MTVVLLILGCLAGLVFINAAFYGLHRWLIVLEQRGYIYYRERPRGGGGGVFLEMDRLMRPSVQHVQQAMDLEVESQEHDGE